MLYADAINVNEEAIRLMVKCWNESSSNRPTFPEIKAYITKFIQRGKYANTRDTIHNIIIPFRRYRQAMFEQNTYRSP